MAINVRIRNVPNYVVRTVGIGGNVNVTGSDTFAGLNDVDASSSDDGETVVFDSNTQKFVVKKIPIIDGGTF